MSEKKQNYLRIWASILIPSIIGGFGSLFAYYATIRETFATQAQFNNSIQHQVDQKVNRETFDLTHVQNNEDHKEFKCRLDEAEKEVRTLAVKVAGK